MTIGMAAHLRLAHSVYRIFAGRPMQLYENGEIDISGVYLLGH